MTKQLIPMTIALACALSQGTWAQTEAGNGDTEQNALTGSGTEADPYLIGSVEDWCTLASSVEAGNTYNRMVFKMTADIDLGDSQVMVGTTDHAFGGNFDGQGHTLTIHYVSTEDNCAPFRCILQNNVTFQNLHVTGTINTSGKSAGGLVGTDKWNEAVAYTTQFLNIRSSVEITSTVEGAGYHGGLAGHICTYPTFMNCLFDGSLLGPATTTCGGLLGNFDANNRCYVRSCIYNPKEQTVSGEGSATFVVNNGGYVQVEGQGYWPGDAFYMCTLGTAQGKDASAMDKTELLNTLGGEWQLLDDGQLVPLMPVAKPLTGSGTEQDPYIISSADDWATLKDNVMSGRDYRSKYFRQTKSFTTSEMVGSIHHPFTGMYDGGGNTITFNIGSEASPSTWTYLAPFRYTQKDDKTNKVSFSNIHIDGSIYTSAKFAAGLIAYAWGPVEITNCRCSVSIISSVEGDGTHGGFIGYIDSYRNRQTYSITGCTFDGRMMGDKTTCWGGFVGWQENIIFVLTDCLFIPRDKNAEASGSENFFRCPENKYFVTITRAYYYSVLNSSSAEGTRVYSVLSARDGISFSMGTPKATYSVSNIDVFDNGVKYSDNFYPCQGATVTIESSLKGYRFTCNKSSASINGNKLTMGNDNYTTVDVALIDWATEYQGTEADPYMIQNAAQMNMVAERVNASDSEHYTDKYFVLGNDIDYDGTENNYTPVGYGSTITYNFGGHFDGQGYRISGININSDNPRQAVFGVVNGGTVKNLTLTNSTISGNGDGHGAIVGYLRGNGTVDNCHVASTVSVSGRHYTGGIVGDNFYGSITNSSSSATVSGGSCVGGIVGSNGYESSTDVDCTLENNIYCGTTVTGSSFVGAIAGNNTSTSNNHFTYSNNYYTAVGAKGVNGADVTADDGAVPALRDNADNSSAIDLLKAIPENAGAYSVKLSGRTLYKDGSWNTLCLPFDLELEGSPLEGATLKTLASSDYDTATGTLTLTFADASSIEAGKPYIIKWTSGDNFTPTFTDVTIGSADPTDATGTAANFHGIYSPYPIKGEDKTMLYLGGNSKLYYPNAEMTIGAFRAYFLLNNGLTAGGLPNEARHFVLNFCDGEQTGIASPKSSPEGKDFSPLLQEGTGEAWYALDGRRLSGRPTQSGIYIHQGKKIVIK